MSEPHPATRWDVYRDAEGNPVTITPQQCAAIKHAAAVWAEVTAVEDYPNYPAIGHALDMFLTTVMEKSCLMGRMLYDGKPPFDDKPPLWLSAPIYQQWDLENESVTPAIDAVRHTTDQETQP